MKKIFLLCITAMFFGCDMFQSPVPPRIGEEIISVSNREYYGTLVTTVTGKSFYSLGYKPGDTVGRPSLNDSVYCPKVCIIQQTVKEKTIVIFRNGQYEGTEGMK